MKAAFGRLYTYMLYIAAGATLFVFFVNTFIYIRTRAYIYQKTGDVPQAQAAMIPGAAVAGGTLSPVFEDRVKAAIALYRSGKISKILVSGDNSSKYYNEVNPVKNYLRDEGIPAERIFLDHAGLDTYSTMYRAREIFKAESAIVTSQAFHLPRAVFIGRKLGIETYGLVSQRSRVSLKNYVRESLASVKAVLDILLRRQPKHLGDPIPLDGEQSS